jgi:hypothetical protein
VGRRQVDAPTAGGGCLGDDGRFRYLEKM